MIHKLSHPQSPTTGNILFISDTKILCLRFELHFQFLEVTKGYHVFFFDLDLL